MDPWTCSNGWPSRWKVWHCVKFRSVCGKNAAVTQEVCDDWKQRKLLPVLRKYAPDDIFNADETRLYWRLLPDKTHAVAGKVCTGGKKSKERVPVLVCANMSGSEKLPLLTIGKFKKPRCFRGVTCLPAHYEANTSAWMNSAVFEEWLQKWDAKLTSSKRKIALVLDNCTAHPRVQSLQSIELIFLPPNTTSEIQPCDQGIIQALKVHYRKNMVKCLIYAINRGSTVVNFKITLLDGLQMLRKAWESVTASTISNCFHKVGFVPPFEPEMEEEDLFLNLNDEETASQDIPLQQLQLENPCTFDDYVAVDNDLQCAPLLTTEDIVSSVNITSEDVVENDDTGDPLPPVTYERAYSALQELRSYLLHSSPSESLYRLLSDLETKVFKAGSTTLVQTMIREYFQ